MSLMPFEAIHIREAFTTTLTFLDALANSLVPMNFLVYFIVGHLREVFSTLITSIGFLSSVNFLVSFQFGDGREVFSTLIAAVLSLLSQAYFSIHPW